MLQELAEELQQAIVDDDKSKMMQYMKELHMLCNCFLIGPAYGYFYPSFVKMLISSDEEIKYTAYNFLKTEIGLSTIFEHGGILPLDLIEEKMSENYTLQSACLFLDFHYPQETKRLIKKNLDNFFSHEMDILIPYINDMLKDDADILNLATIQYLLRIRPYVAIDNLKDELLNIQTKKQILSLLKDSVPSVIYEHHYKKVYKRKPQQNKKNKQKIEYLSEEQFISGLVKFFIHDINKNELKEYLILKKTILGNHKISDSFLYPEELGNLTQWRQLKQLSCFKEPEENPFNLDSYQEMADVLGFNISCHTIVNQIFVYFDMASLLNLDESIFNSQDGIFRFDEEEESQKFINQLKNVTFKHEEVLML